MIRTNLWRAAVAVTVGLIAHPVTHVRASTTPDSDADAGWEITDIAPIDVAGTVMSLSPDGSWLAGTADDDNVCIWAVADLAATCTDAVRAVDPESISWAPDSSAIAFSTLAFLYFVDSDIHVFDVDGSLTNATDDGFDDRLQIGDQPTERAVPVDVMPAWTPDSTAVVFSRFVWNDESRRESTEIMTVRRDGGEPALLGSIARRAAIFTPMRVLSDGAVIYTAAPIDPSDELNGIWRLEADGTRTQLIAGDESVPFPVPVIASIRDVADGLAVTGYSRVNAAAHVAGDDPVAFQWSSAPGDPVPLTPVTPDELAWVVSAAISPDGGSLVQLTVAQGGSVVVEVVGPATSSTALPEIDSSGIGPPPRTPIPTWADNGTVFVPAFGQFGPAILSMSPSAATTTTGD